MVQKSHPHSETDRTNGEPAGTGGLPVGQQPQAGRWIARGKGIAIDGPRVVGILNVTPDSFSDGGRYWDPVRAVDRAHEMMQEGADILDVGGESTRPGSALVSDSDEIARVIPVIGQLRRELPAVPLSIDTTKSTVARAALDAGADIVNDVSGLRLDKEMARVVAQHSAGVILMHSRGGAGELASYALATYENPVDDILNELGASVGLAVDAEVPPEAIVIDPGLGFAKRTEHSIAIVRAIPRLSSLGFPVLVGASRKRFIGEISSEDDPGRRLDGTLGVHVAALGLGARLFRVHDVRAHRLALDAAWAVLAPADADRSAH